MSNRAKAVETGSVINNRSNARNLLVQKKEKGENTDRMTVWTQSSLYYIDRKSKRSGHE